jgi:histidyl-tRNA synthetase
METLEYLRLPKGFHVRDENYIFSYNNILNTLVDCSRLCGYEIALLPSLGFIATFDKGANIVGNKAYQFLDKKGREVVLTPDSTAGLLRWHLEAKRESASTKVGWCAPIFRYRNVENRFFNQIGFSYINVKGIDQDVDWPLIDATNSLLRLVKRTLGSSASVKINNIGALKKIFSVHLLPEEVSSLVSRLHKEKSDEGRLQILDSKFPESKEKNALLSIFGADITLKEESERLIETMYEEMRLFAENLKNVNQIQYALDSLHSSEIISGLGIEFYTNSGSRIGDGGRYDDFANKFDKKCESLVSVCTGVEALIKNQAFSTHRPTPMYDLTLIRFTDSQSLLKSCIHTMRENGISVQEVTVVRNMKSAIISAQQKARFYCIVGKSERQKEQFVLHDQFQRSSMVIPFEHAESLLLDLLKEGYV